MQHQRIAPVQQQLELTALAQTLAGVANVHLEVAELLLRLDHAHVDILLVRRGNLLLLLLEDLDLLCNGELLHCRAISRCPRLV